MRLEAPLSRLAATAGAVEATRPRSSSCTGRPGDAGDIAAYFVDPKKTVTGPDGKPTAVLRDASYHLAIGRGGEARPDGRHGRHSRHAGGGQTGRGRGASTSDRSSCAWRTAVRSRRRKPPGWEMSACSRVPTRRRASAATAPVRRPSPTSRWRRCDHLSPVSSTRSTRRSLAWRPTRTRSRQGSGPRARGQAFNAWEPGDGRGADPCATCRTGARKRGSRGKCSSADERSRCARRFCATTGFAPVPVRRSATGSTAPRSG